MSDDEVRESIFGSKALERSAKVVDLSSMAPAARAFKPYGSPPRFDLDEFKDTFELWHCQWKIFLALSTIDTVLEKDDRPEYKTNILLSCLSKETLQAVLTMGLSDSELEDHEVIIEQLRDRCNAGRNRHVWRQQFAMKKQRANEAADNWLCELRELASKCEFFKDCCNKCQPTRILGQIVFGVYDDDVRRKLLEKGDDLKLDEAIEILRVAEAASAQAKNLKQGDALAIQGLSKSSYKKDKLNKSSKPQAKQQSSSSQSNQTSKKDGKSVKFDTSSKGCWNCGGETRHPRSDCPANGKDCGKCGKTGHFKKVCNSNGIKKNTTPSAQTGCIGLESDSPTQVSGIGALELVQMTISPNEGSKSISLSVLPDTGAQIDAIPADLFHSEFSPIKLMPGEINMITAIGSRIINLGHFKATICWPNGNSNNKASSIIHVLQDLKQPVISKATQKKLGMLPAGYPNQRVEIFNINAHQVAFSTLLANIHTHPSEGIKRGDLRILTNAFPLIFDGVCRPMAGPACHFELKKDAVPVAFRGSRPVAEPLMPLLKKELDLLEQQDCIRKVSKPTPWVHPIVIAPKGGYTSVRGLYYFKQKYHPPTF